MCECVCVCWLVDSAVRGICSSSTPTCRRERKKRPPHPTQIEDRRRRRKKKEEEEEEDIMKVPGYPGKACQHLRRLVNWGQYVLVGTRVTEVGCTVVGYGQRASYRVSNQLTFELQRGYLHSIPSYPSTQSHVVLQLFRHS